MKLKYVFFLLFLSISSMNVEAQIKDVKDKSDENKKGRNNQNNNNNNNNNSGGFNMPACSGACMNACAGACANFGAQVVIAGQQAYLDRRDEISHMVSLDIMGHGGYVVSDDSYLVIPRLRVNWAMFSTDIRFNAWFEADTSGGLDFANTTDWSVIQFNPIITKHFILRIGTGFMYENYSKIFYNEHYLGCDVLLNDDDYMISAEGRWAKDYQTGANPRTEANLRFNLKYWDNKHFDNYFMFGGVYQNYYESIDLWTVQAGVTVNFH